MSGEGDFKRVLLGFSGGVDSVAALGLLRQRGLEVAALTLNTTGDEQMLQGAVAKAQELGVKHIVKDVRREFDSKIVDYFLSSYVAGRTPAPCTMCNPLIKWYYLISEANRLGIDAVATGHYFNVVKSDGLYYVAKALDARKDQSYYLWGLSQSTLSRVITPMGQIIKQDINPVFSKSKESMGLCFLHGKSYGEFIQERIPSACLSGEIVTKDGCVVGQHSGIAFYTIGQKKGVETSVAGMRVVAIDADSNRLIVSDNNDLYHHTLEVGGCNIVSKDEFLQSKDVSVVIRGIGRNPEGYIRCVEEITSGYRITLEHPAWAPAVGQPVVFYRGDRVIGGGILERYY